MEADRALRVRRRMNHAQLEPLPQIDQLAIDQLPVHPGRPPGRELDRRSTSVQPLHLTGEDMIVDEVEVTLVVGVLGHRSIGLVDPDLPSGRLHHLAVPSRGIVKAVRVQNEFDVPGLTPHTRERQRNIIARRVVDTAVYDGGYIALQ